MKVLLLALLAGACLAAPSEEKRNMAAMSSGEPSGEAQAAEVSSDTIVGRKDKGDTGEMESESSPPQTDDAKDYPDYMADGTLDNLNMYYDCSDGAKCRLVTGKGDNIGNQMPLKGDIRLTQAMTPTLQTMAASLGKLQEQKNMLANLQREMAALAALGSKGVATTKSVQPLMAQKGDTLMLSSSKGGSAALLMRESAMCPMLKFELDQSKKVKTEMQVQMESTNSMAALTAAQKLKTEQELLSCELMKEAAKTAAQKAAMDLMVEKRKNDQLAAALTQCSSDKSILEQQKAELEKQLAETQQMLIAERADKARVQDEKKRVEEEKALCLTQLLNTQNALTSEKAEKQKVLQELAKTATELAETKNALEVETTLKNQCEIALTETRTKLALREQELDAERAAHAKTQEALTQTTIALRTKEQELAITELRLRQTQAELMEKEQDLARTQATLEATEEKLARTMATLEATQAILRNTQSELEAERIVRAQVEAQLAVCDSNLAACESARLALEETKQRLEDQLADTQAALLDMTAQRDQMKANFENAMRLLADEKAAKAAVEAALTECNAMKMTLAAQLQQALEMFTQAKKTNEELAAMFEQVKAASAMMQAQLDRLQLENIQLQAEVDKLRKEQEAALALAAGCPLTYEKFAGSCYKYVREKTAWKLAQESCMRDGGNLVSIETATEQQYVLDHLTRHGASQQDTHMYVGAERDPISMLWKWRATGTIVGRDTPNYWYSDVQKDKRDANCMAMYLYDANKIGKFASRPCEVGTTYMCEVNILPPYLNKPSPSELAYLSSNMGSAPSYLQAAYQPMTKSAPLQSAPLYNSGKGSSTAALMAAARLSNKGTTMGLLAASKAAQLESSKSASMMAAQLAHNNQLLTAAMTMTKGRGGRSLLPKGDDAPLTNAQMASLLAAATKGEQEQ